MTDVAYDDGASGRSTLTAALRVGLGWWNQAAPESVQQRNIAQMRQFIGGRLIAEDYSPETLTTVRTMFCVNCRKVHTLGLRPYVPEGPWASAFYWPNPIRRRPRPRAVETAVH